MGNSKEWENGLKQFLYFTDKTDTTSGPKLSNVTCSWCLTRGVLSHASPTQYINKHVFQSRNDIRKKKNLCTVTLGFSLWSCSIDVSHQLTRTTGAFTMTQVGFNRTVFIIFRFISNLEKCCSFPSVWQCTYFPYLICPTCGWLCIHFRTEQSSLF